MDGPINISGNELMVTVLLVLGGALLLALILMAYVFWQVRRLNVPRNADVLTTLRATPFVVVLMLDLLDFSLDFLSAPLAWIILSRLGLQGLRGVTVVESLIPGTQFLPTMSAAWVVARLFPNLRLPGSDARPQAVEGTWRRMEDRR